MKRSLIVSALAVTLLVGTAASAQNALFDTANASAQVTFYSADPADGAEELATATVNNSPAAVTIDGIDNARYVTVTYDGESRTFELTDSGQNKNEVVLAVASPTESAQLVSDSGTLTLTELLDGLATNPDLLEQLQATPVSCPCSLSPAL